MISCHCLVQGLFQKFFFEILVKKYSKNLDTRWQTLFKVIEPNADEITPFIKGACFKISVSVQYMSQIIGYPPPDISHYRQNNRLLSLISPISRQIC